MKKKKCPEKTIHYCYFCGKTKHLEQHHIIFKRFIKGKGLKKNKEWVCKNCHKKLHHIMQPLVDLLLSVIQKLQPHEMNKIGFVYTNGKKKKGGK